MIVFLILGGIIAIGGISLLIDGNIGAGLFGIIIGAIFIGIWILIKRKKSDGISRIKTAKSKKEIKLTPLPEGYVKTYTFECAGIHYECKYPCLVWTKRQEIIEQMKIGDLVYLKEYEWESKPAFAVMSTRLNADVGVVWADKVDDILAMQNEYDLLGEIAEIKVVNIKGTDYMSPIIELHCYEKGTINIVK